MRGGELTKQLAEALIRHYCPPGKPAGGIVVTECGLNNSYGAQRFCDLLHVGFTSTSGRLLRGHEVKVSRADWLHELKEVEKASVWADACHEWWIVTPATGIVKPEELPPGWGLMTAPKGNRRLFTVEVPAARKPAEHEPSWLVTRSIMARLDTLQTELRRTMRQDVWAEALTEAEKRVSQQHRDSDDYQTRDTLKAAAELEALLGGVRLSGYTNTLRGTVSAQDLVAAVNLVHQLRSATIGYDGIAAIAGRLNSEATKLTRLANDIKQLEAGLQAITDATKTPPAAMKAAS